MNDNTLALQEFFSSFGSFRAQLSKNLLSSNYQVNLFLLCFFMESDFTSKLNSHDSRADNGDVFGITHLFVEISKIVLASGDSVSAITFDRVVVGKAST